MKHSFHHQDQFTWCKITCFLICTVCFGCSTSSCGRSYRNNVSDWASQISNVLFSLECTSLSLHFLNAMWIIHVKMWMFQKLLNYVKCFLVLSSNLKSGLRIMCPSNQTNVNLTARNKEIFLKINSTWKLLDLINLKISKTW